jgi:pantoate--beta-alanine ligase
MTAPQIVTTIAELRQTVAAWRGQGLGVGLVPTMGALHEGHVSLVRETQKRADKSVVSIFVNPTQFGPQEDFSRYPRQLAADAETLGTARADLIFAPGVSEMYPDGFATRIEVAGPSQDLEGDVRPGHFSGVATVVAKLLLAVMPDIAAFGEKDYQQLLVVKRLARDLALPVEIVGCATLREADGLAMSSRNAYLSPEERRIAGRLNLVLRDVASRVRAGAPIGDAEHAGHVALRDAGFASVDYVAVRDAESLARIETLSRPARVLAAAKIGSTRLIDNMAV